MSAVFGDLAGLRLELGWEAVLDVGPAGPTAAEATRGTLVLAVAGEPLWHGKEAQDGFSWTWVELLEFLAQAWPYLTWEDGLPFGLKPATASAISALAEARWQDLPREFSAEEEADFEAYEEVHNLARAVQGAWLPPLWIVREGELCWLCGSSSIIQRPLAETIATLESVGQYIAQRLIEVAPDEARAVAALKHWTDRDAMPRHDLVQIATGLADVTLREVERGLALDDAWDLSGDEFELNELLAAARMATGLPPTVVSDIVRHIRVTRGGSTSELDSLAARIDAEIDDLMSGRPFEQAHTVAHWLRRDLDIETEGRVDPVGILEEWGVKIQNVELDAPDIDAFACWGPRHGPVVFINSIGRHNGSEGGRRASLAHELCHLLVDRRRALPLAEVLGGRTAPSAESRAGAFAAELLIPSTVAGREMSSSKNPHRTLSALQRRFGVSREVIAWQARNSGESLSQEAVALLRRNVSQPWRF